MRGNYKLRKRYVQFGQESCPAGEYLHSERLWMLEKVSASLKTNPTTIPQSPHISKNPQKKKINLKRYVYVELGDIRLKKIKFADDESVNSECLKLLL